MPTSVDGPNCGLLVTVFTLGQLLRTSVPVFILSSPGRDRRVWFVCIAVSKIWQSMEWRCAFHINYIIYLFSLHVPLGFGRFVLHVTFADTTEVIESLKVTVCFTMLKQTFWLVPILLAEIGVDGQMIWKIYFHTEEVRVQHQAVRVGFGIFQWKKVALEATFRRVTVIVKSDYYLCHVCPSFRLSVSFRPSLDKFS